MRAFPGRSAAAAMLVVGTIIRMFWGLTIAYPDALNASWLCPLVGLLLFLPFVFALRCLDDLGNGGIWFTLSKCACKPVASLCALAFAGFLLYDSAASARLMASSINFVALNDTAIHLLILPLGAVAWIGIMLGGDALGNSARMWLRIMPIFVLLVLLVQFKSYELGWLSPILGNGLPSILRGGVYCAGCMAISALIWLVSIPDRNRHGLLRYSIIVVFSATALLLTQQMLNPALLDTPLTHSGRIDLVLSNGRLSLSPQILLDILWYGNLLYLLTSELVACSNYVRFCFSKPKRWILASAEAGGMLIVSIFSQQIVRGSILVTSMLYAAIGALLALMMGLYIATKGDDRRCEGSGS